MSTRRLEPLQRLAERRVGEAESRYLERRRQLAEQQHRLDDLGRYLAEYRALPGAEVSPQLLRNRLAFAARVDEALRQQSVAVERARRAADVQQGAWVAAERDKDALERLLARRRLAERRRSESRTQRELDEFAARATRRAP